MTDEIIYEPITEVEEEQFEIASLEWSIEREIKELEELIGVSACHRFIDGVCRK